MAEPKPLASLTSGLLARKGAAVPAMRRPAPMGFANGAAIAEDDLGWNDMGQNDGGWGSPAQPLPMAGLTPMALPEPGSVPAVVAQREALARKVATASDSTAKPIPAIKPLAAGRKAAFTLRLDAERHLKLRLACAVQNRSAQQIVTDAIDQFLSGMPDIDRIADQLPRNRGDI